MDAGYRHRALGGGWLADGALPFPGCRLGGALAFIEYLRPAFAGDRLGLHTWVPRFDQRSTPRRYLFVREPGHQMVAEAEARWVFVDLGSGRRRQLPPALLDAFEALPDERIVRQTLGLAG